MYIKYSYLICCLLLTAKFNSISSSEFPLDETSFKISTELLHLRLSKDSSQPNSSYPWNQFRLNPDVIPMRYDITFQPNITNEQSNFSGHVTIEVQVRQPIDAFIVHADAELNITKSLLSTNDNQSIEIESEFRNLPFQFYILKLRNKVKPNVFKLYFEFHGNMADRTWSLYKGSYQIGNKTIGVAATQFEMHNARIAFPCFDEPGFKSIYKVNIVHEPQHNVYSNMNPVKRYSNSNGLITTEFNQTLKISSYLLAIVVGEFVCVNNSIDDIIVSACSSPIQQHKLNYSLDLATKLMGYYTDYFQISYPLSKIEHIAIPVDFAAGAMENWGLILYQEKLFLYDDEDTTTTDKMEVNSVIAHELSHQWYGNLVTMKWWEDIWLKEGFANFLSYIGVDKMEPTWEYLHHFVLNDWIKAIDADADVNHNNLIVRKINGPDEMRYSVSIVYNKGASMLRMLEFIMGKKNFRLALGKYLTKHKYDNTKTQDLFDALNQQMNGRLNITNLMSKWIFTAGFPYINMTKIRSQDNKHTYKLVQQRYFSSGNKSSNDYWTIPLSYYNASNQVIIEYIDTIESEITVSFKNNLPKFNVESTGFYLINYSPEDWKTITNALTTNSSLFTPSDRANLIAESFYLSRGHLLNYATAFNLSLYLQNEQHFVPWAVFQANEVLGFFKIIGLTEYSDYYKNYIKLITTKQLDRLKWTDDGGDNQRRLRSIIFELACLNDNNNCLEGANKEFNAWKNGKRLKPNLQQVVLKYGIRNNDDNWQFLWNKYLKSNDSNQDKLTYLNSLANTKNETLIKRLLNYSLDDQIIAKQNTYPLLSSLAGNTNGKTILWNFYYDHLLSINTSLGESYYMLLPLGRAICRNFIHENDKQKVSDLFNAYKNRGIDQAFANYLIETIDENIKWIEIYKDTIGNWLKKLPKLY